MPASPGGKYLLIADDYDDAASLMASLVEAVSSYQTGHAKDGQQALAPAAVRRPDACLLDIDMPHIDGLEAAQRLRETFGEALILIAMTGSHRLHETARSGFFNHVLSKPVDLMQLLILLGESPKR